MKKIEDLTYNYPPNFSVIVPGGCNARCAFCFWKQEKECKNYLEVLEDTIMKLPKEFEVVSLTGGEPTLNPNLGDIVGVLKKRFNKIVLTTNGEKLIEFIQSNKNLPTHVNISRHGYNWISTKDIFKVEPILDGTVMLCNNILNSLNISSTMNVVCTDLPLHNYEDFILYAKSLDFNRLCFRIDHKNGKYSKEFPFHSKYESENPVSKCAGYLIKGMVVEVRSSALEAVDIVDYCHEAVFHPSGKITLDWKGEHEIDMGGDILAVDGTNNNEDVLKVILNEINKISKRLDKLESPVTDEEREEDYSIEAILKKGEYNIIDNAGNGHGYNPRAGHGGGSSRGSTGGHGYGGH